MFEKAKELYTLQKQAREIKKKLSHTHIEAEQDGVKVVINGEQEVVQIEIADEAMTDKKKLEKTLETCFNKAVKKSQQIGAELMKQVMGDKGFPGLGQ